MEIAWNSHEMLLNFQVFIPINFLKLPFKISKLNIEWLKVGFKNHQ
jgi:hypothetical protein